ncbi:MAG: hypothetical protein K0S86_575 [Geminicoccaceae bacterium]|jgi:hypothetical protein|nr:hypothetical protein [Geminicoccaceae bacterium]
MTRFRFYTSTPVSVFLVALATVACRDPNAPPTADSTAAVGSPQNTMVGSVLVAKPKKNKPVIESVQLSTSALELNSGIAATYSVTIYNPFGRMSRTYTDANLQGEIRQGAVVAAAGGFQVSCSGGPYEQLPLGTCTVSGLTISTVPGLGSLTPGAANFALTLYSESDGFPPVTAIVPVTLVVTPVIP